MDDEGVTKVMHTRAGSPVRWLQARSSEHTDEQLFDHDAGVPAGALLMPEETGRRVHRRTGPATGVQIRADRRDDARRERQPT